MTARSFTGTTLSLGAIAAFLAFAWSPVTTYLDASQKAAAHAIVMEARIDALEAQAKSASDELARIGRRRDRMDEQMSLAMSDIRAATAATEAKVNVLLKEWLERPARR